MMQELIIYNYAARPWQTLYGTDMEERTRFHMNKIVKHNQLYESGKVSYWVSTNMPICCIVNTIQLRAIIFEQLKRNLNALELLDWVTAFILTHNVTLMECWLMVTTRTRRDNKTLILLKILEEKNGSKTVIF